MVVLAGIFWKQDSKLGEVTAEELHVRKKVSGDTAGVALLVRANALKFVDLTIALCPLS